MQERIKVLYIAGGGRSGTTLLERLLGQVKGLFAAGELRYIWERGFRGNELCGCGSAFKDCDFWKEVVKRAFGDSMKSTEAVAKATGLQGAIDRLRFTPLLRYGFRRRQMKAFCEEYLLPLYSAIREVSGGDIIIDSSKKPSYLYILAQCGFVDLYVIHVVRDPRAVAYSWSKTKLRPEVVGRDDYMPKVSSVKSAVWWAGYNALVLRVSKEIQEGRYTLVNYDDLAGDPKRTVSVILNSAGVGSDLSFFKSDNRAELKPNHTVAGNPMRFKTGLIDIRQDDEWKSKMSFMAKMTTSVMTFPLMRRLCR